MQDRPHFAVHHHTANDNAENSDLVFHSHDRSSEPVPSASSKLVDIRPPTQEGKQTSQESACVSKRPIPKRLKNVQNAMEGTKLEDTKSSAVIHLACT